MPITDQKLPTQADVQKQFDAASTAGVSPCMWIPPQWEDLKAESNKRFFHDNSADDEPFKNPEGSDEAKELIKKGDARKGPESPESPPNKEHWTNAFADFTHVDDLEFPTRSLDLVRKALDPDRDAQKIDLVLAAVAGKFRDMRAQVVDALQGDERLFEAALKVLDGKAVVEPQELELVARVIETPGGAAHDAVQKIAKGHVLTLEDVVSVIRGTRPELLARRNALNRLQRIVGADSPGMKRLALVFDWALYRTTQLMDDLNKALAKSQREYQVARDNYLQFLRDLDDHEAEKDDTRNLDPTDKKSPGGYGKALKWACIDPVIFRGQIVGARVIIRWNPHSSSNGKPIPHS